MPVFFQKELNSDTRMAVWKIEEDEDFFLSKAVPQRQVSHPHKRLQHLAGRYLLKYLFEDFPVELIRIADTRKPFLEDDVFHFSISHCGDFAAAIVSKTRRVGVDIEQIRPTVGKVQHKFVSKEELVIGNWDLGSGQIESTNFQIPNSQLLATDLRLLTLLWSCKEAVYKWYGWGEVDFKDHIVVREVKQLSELDFETTVCFQKNEPIMLKLNSKSYKELVLSYVVS